MDVSLIEILNKFGFPTLMVIVLSFSLRQNNANLRAMVAVAAQLVENLKTLQTSLTTMMNAASSTEARLDESIHTVEEKVIGVGGQVEAVAEEFRPGLATLNSLPSRMDVMEINLATLLGLVKTLDASTGTHTIEQARILALTQQVYEDIQAIKATQEIPALKESGVS